MEPIEFEMLKAFKEAVQSHDVIITSYTLVRMDEAMLSAQTWQRLVIDEAQNIKNPKAAQTRAIFRHFGKVGTRFWSRWKSFTIGLRPKIRPCSNFRAFI